MDIIFRYDIDRLKAYLNNKEYDNNIRIMQSKELSMLCFPEVDYFNYSFISDKSPIELSYTNEIRQFYKIAGISSHKIIAPATCSITHEILCNQLNYNHIKTIVKTSFPIGNKLKDNLPIEINLTKVDEFSIYDFARVYLNGFESIVSEYKKVAANFKQLLEVSDISLFFITIDSKHVGISVLYKNEFEYLLAGGAILKEFRNNHFHKQSMFERIKRSLLKDDVEGIYSSAYKNSISAQNMTSIGMSIKESYNVYEYRQ